MIELTESQKKICADREAVYGDSLFNHDAIGIIWTGILECYFQQKLPKPISGSMVCTLMAAIKMARFSFGKYRTDDYVDAAVYLSLAEKGRKQDEAKK